jgi:AraC-like DNA-binding protein
VADLYVALPVVTSVLAAAEQVGIDRNALLEEIGLDEDALADPERLVPEAVEQALWEAIVRQAGDTSVGLRAAQCLPKGSLQVVEYLTRTSPNLGAGIKLLPKFTRLLRSYSVQEVKETVQGLRVINHREYDIRSPAGIADLESAVGTFVMIGRDATGVEFVPAEVTFRHSRSSSDEAYALLGPNVSFDQPQTSLLIDRTTLAAPMLEADPTLHDILQRCAAKRLEEMPQASPTTAEVRDVLLDLLPREEPSLDVVAARLETSSRMLQRKLQDEGTTFRAVVERVREQIAKRYLAETRLTTVDVAMLLDYSDAPSFHRAFKRWTGMSPGEYRRSITDGG